MTLRLRNTDTAIALEVSIGGPKGTATLLMLLDTGSTFVALPTIVAERLGYDTANPIETVVTTTASGSVRAPIVMLASVSALGAELTDVPDMCLDLPAQAHFQGLLGLSFLRRFDVDLHFRSGSIAFR